MGEDNIIYTVATWLIPLVIAIVFHEVAHGWVARYYGDHTASNAGRLTLNPIKHVDPIGTVILPTILAVSGAPIFGWAKPVPVVSKRLDNPRVHMMIVAFAGPASNLILAFIGTALLAVMSNFSGGLTGMGDVATFIAANLFNFVIINIFLALFNLLPIPPFDGSHIVEGLLPRDMARRYLKLRKYSFPILLVFLVGIPMLFPEARILETLLLPPLNFMLSFYFGIFGLNVA